MEARIARIESDVAHLQTDVADIKLDLRGLRTRMDQQFDHLESKVDSKFTWAMSLGAATAAGMLGAMARGFGWL